VGVGGIVIDGSCPVWFAVAVLVRELLVAGATLGLAAMGARRIDVTWFGKAGTFGLMVAFPLFLASHSTLGWADTAGTLAWIAGIPGLVFSYISLVMYVPLGLQALRAGRADRATRVGSTS
jgi:cardiolipin synthase (CMP-forming)